MIALAALVAVEDAEATLPLPAPFHRQLEVGMNGSDIYIMQHLLSRCKATPYYCTGDAVLGPTASNCTGVFDSATLAALEAFQQQQHLHGTTTVPGQFDASTAQSMLAELSSDGFKDDGVRAADFRLPNSTTGYKYKVVLPVHRNRSMETVATLLDSQNKILLHFKARAHGHDVDANGQGTSKDWPDFSDSGCPPDAFLHKQGCIGLNSFSRDGSTPTGLYEIDLNSPEDEPSAFGPFPINRFVRGVAGNAKILVGGISAPCPMHIRSGILLHTGAWGNFSRPPWQPGEPMPNSDGCVHAYPNDVKTIWKLLVEDCGVEVHNNTGGALPYPYQPQGLAVVYEVE